MPSPDPTNNSPSSSGKSSESISDRRFRRYNRRKMRQNKAAREDAIFYRAVFSIAGIGAAIAIGLAVFAMNGGGDLSGLSGLAQPWIGPLSKLEAMGLAFIALLAGSFFWRIRKRK